jgi:hypothetical protein
MLTSSIGVILIVSGGVTALAGSAALLLPRLTLRLAFGESSPTASTLFFAIHWGALIFLVGALTVYSSQSVAIRTPILIAAAIEKFLIVGLVFFGPLRRTKLMTLIAATDGLFAVLYTVYLVTGGA